MPRVSLPFLPDLCWDGLEEPGNQPVLPNKEEADKLRSLHVVLVAEVLRPVISSQSEQSNLGVARLGHRHQVLTRASGVCL
jgi:hypothetical protein